MFVPPFETRPSDVRHSRRLEQEKILILTGNYVLLISIVFSAQMLSNFSDLFLYDLQVCYRFGLKI